MGSRKADRIYSDVCFSNLAKRRHGGGRAVVVFLFLAALWFTESIINGPNFHPKSTLAAPTIYYSVSCCVSC